jgi:prolyl oligopeptidase PreP (S9A serine peptidase family)
LHHDAVILTATLLRMPTKAGHGIGTSLASAVDEQADAQAFLFEQLGMR